MALSKKNPTRKTAQDFVEDNEGIAVNVGAGKKAPILKLDIKVERATYHLLGTSPLIFNAMSNKMGPGWEEGDEEDCLPSGKDDGYYDLAMEMLLPKQKEKGEKRQLTPKHYPFREFRNSVYTVPDGPTHLAHLGVAFKKSMALLALDMGESSKSQMERLVHVDEQRVPIWGIPRMFMSFVRLKNAARTPDIRTRGILHEWASKVTITYVRPNISEPTVTSYLATAGVLGGLGDWRPNRGSGTYGRWEIVDPSNPDYQRIVRQQGRAKQITALEKALPYDDETERLIGWFGEAAIARNFEEALT